MWRGYYSTDATTEEGGAGGRVRHSRSLGSTTVSGSEDGGGPPADTASSARIPARRLRPLGIDALPPDLLADVLGLLDFRYSTAALVCKAWRAACDAPHLLASLAVSFGHGPGLTPPLEWLLPRAGHVQQLAITGPLDAGLGAQLQATADVAALLQRCTQLTTLHLGVPTSLLVSDWLAEVAPHLEALRCAGPVFDNVAFSTRLTQLRLDCSPGAHSVLSAVPALPRLVVLDIPVCSGPVGGMSNLAAMSALRRLRMDGGAPVPGVLPALAQLTELECQPAAATDPMLAQLTALVSLRSLRLTSCSPAYVLPGGAWLARLRRLVANSNALARVLGRTPNLRQLGVLQYTPDGRFSPSLTAASMARAVQAAAALSALTRVQLSRLPAGALTTVPAQALAEALGALGYAPGRRPGALPIQHVAAGQPMGPFPDDEP